VPSCDSLLSVVGRARTSTLGMRMARVSRSLRKSPVGALGMSITAVVIFLAVFGSWVSPHDPLSRNLRARFEPPGYRDDTGVYLLGTDQLGRDVLSRIIAGSRVSVAVGVTAVAVAGTIGVLVGLVSAYIGGWVDTVLMRIVDAFLSIPFIIIAVAVSGVVGPGLITIVLILALVNWVTYARLVRGEVLSVKEEIYVLSARALGQPPLQIMLRHVLPNVIPTAIVVATLEIAVTILAESSLSFLGLGVQPPSITWGLMLADGRQYLGSAWWMATFPGIAITITVLGVIFLGDWLRDVLDPSLRGHG